MTSIGNNQQGWGKLFNALKEQKFELKRRNGKKGSYIFAVYDPQGNYLTIVSPRARESHALQNKIAELRRLSDFKYNGR
jgi:hypothetical protein